jgi:hypothetical protein
MSKINSQKQENKIKSLRKIIKKNLNKFVKNEKLANAELTIFDKTVSRRDFFVGTAKITALTALVGKGLMPSAFAAEYKDFQLKADDYKDIDPEILKTIQTPAKIIPSADVIDNQILVKDIEKLTDVSEREAVLEGFNNASRLQETVNQQDSDFGLQELNRNYGHPEIVQLNADGNTISIHEYHPEGGLGLINSEFTLTGMAAVNHINTINGDVHNLTSFARVWNKKAIIAFKQEDYNSTDGWFDLQSVNTPSYFRIYYHDTCDWLKLPGQETNTMRLDWTKASAYDPLEDLSKSISTTLSKVSSDKMDKSKLLVKIDHINVHKSKIDQQFIFGTLSIKANPNDTRSFLKVGFITRFLHSYTGKNPFATTFFTLNEDYYINMFNHGMNPNDEGILNQTYFFQSFFPLCEDPGDSKGFIFNCIASQFDQSKSPTVNKLVSFPFKLSSATMRRSSFQALKFKDLDSPLIITPTDTDPYYVVSKKMKNYGIDDGALIKAYYVPKIFVDNLNVIRPTHMDNSSHLINIALDAAVGNRLLMLGDWVKEDDSSSNIVWGRSYYKMQLPGMLSSCCSVSLKLDWRDSDFPELPKGVSIDASTTRPSLYYNDALFTKNHQGLFQCFFHCNLTRTDETTGETISLPNAVICYREGQNNTSTLQPYALPSRRKGIQFDSTLSGCNTGWGNNIVDIHVKRLLNWTNYFNFAECISMGGPIDGSSDTRFEQYNYAIQDHVERSWKEHSLKCQVTENERTTNQHIQKATLHTIELNVLNAYNQPAKPSAGTYMEIRFAEDVYVCDKTNPTAYAYEKVNRTTSFYCKPVNGKVILDVDLGNDPRDLARGTAIYYRLFSAGNLTANQNNSSQNSPKLKFDLGRNDNDIATSFEMFNISYAVHERMANQYDTSYSSSQTNDSPRDLHTRYNCLSQQAKGQIIIQQDSVKSALTTGYTNDNPYAKGNPDLAKTVKEQLFEGKNGNDPAAKKVYSQIAEKSKPQEKPLQSIFEQVNVNISVINPLASKIEMGNGFSSSDSNGFNPLSWISDALKWLKKAIKTAMDAIKKIIDSVLDEIANFADKIGLHGLADAIKFAESVINAVIDSATDALCRILDLIILLFDFKRAWEIAQKIGSIGNGFIDKVINSGITSQDQDSIRDGIFNDLCTNSSSNQKKASSAIKSNNIREMYSKNNGDIGSQKLNKMHAQKSSQINLMNRHISSVKLEENSTNKNFINSDVSDLENKLNELFPKQSKVPDLVKQASKVNSRNTKSMDTSSFDKISDNLSASSMLTVLKDTNEENSGNLLTKITGKGFIDTLLKHGKEGLNNQIHIPVISDILELLGVNPTYMQIASLASAYLLEILALYWNDNFFVSFINHWADIKVDILKALNIVANNSQNSYQNFSITDEERKTISICYTFLGLATQLSMSIAFFVKPAEVEVSIPSVIFQVMGRLINIVSKEIRSFIDPSSFTGSALNWLTALSYIILILINGAKILYCILNIVAGIFLDIVMLLTDIFLTALDIIGFIEKPSLRNAFVLVFDANILAKDSCGFFVTDPETKMVLAIIYLAVDFSVFLVDIIAVTLDEW